MTSEPARRAAELVELYLDDPGRRSDAKSMPEAERQSWGEIGADFDDNGAVEVVRAASQAAYEELIDRSLVGDQSVAACLEVDRSRVSQRVADRSLYSFVDISQQRCFPKWQFLGDKTLPGLKTVLVNLDPELHPLTVDRWFNRPDVDLLVDGAAVSPVTWLSSGGSPDTAADHARFL